jgi:hypothetical protein
MACALILIRIDHAVQEKAMEGFHGQDSSFDNQLAEEENCWRPGWRLGGAMDGDDELMIDYAMDNGTIRCAHLLYLVLNYI